ALVALGTLAAGLAHELNNPAAAAARAVDALRGACDRLLSALGGLASGAFSAEQFRQLELLRREIGGVARLVEVPAAIVPPLSRVAGLPLRDTLVTAEELGALMDELLVSREPPTAATRFESWLPRQGAWLGRRYANELARNWR
ncbi:MAG: hypothetical protein QOJ31_337, partial [Gaiellales bacterium]|nr:hypothetical protein [Gaiellales bacterium]